ncbi:MAG: cbb3-type cytochrome c oxidase subunit I [Thermoplasmata archaeon]
MAAEVVFRRRREWVANGVFRWLFTTDHKDIGILYLVTTMGFFVLGGVLALLMRLELATPGATFVDPATYAQLFSIHGSTMVFLVAIPLFGAFANYMMPILIGAKDMAFPRLNALSFWLIPPAGILIWMGVADVGWTAYAPLSIFEPDRGIDMWILGVMILGTSSILGSLNFVTTIFKYRKPGVTFGNLSLYVWTVLVTAWLILLATPVIASALTMLFLDRNLGTTFFAAEGGSPLLWQHLFWFYSHPAVYIMILPVMGIVSVIIPSLSSKPIFGYKAIAFSTVAIGFMGFGVWVHHMFTTGLDLSVRIPFMLVTMAIAIPSGIKIFNWIATMWGGSIDLKTPMLFAVGFVGMFTIGGLSGVFLAAIPLNYPLQDTYFVVAHLHYVLFGGTMMGIFAGIYFWFPRMSGRMYNERQGVWHFVLTLIGFNLTFFPMHFMGYLGAPRRYADLLDAAAHPLMAPLNLLATIGAFILAFAMLLFFYNLVRSTMTGPPSEPEPWEHL